MDVLLGILALIFGVSVALAGLWLFSLMLPVWGFIAGFLIGAGAVTALAGDGFLATTLGVVVGLIAGIAFALISWFYWYFSVVLAAATAGGVLGASLFATFGVESEWALFFIALVFAVIFAIGAVLLNFPVYLVIVSTAMAGSAIAIGGLLLILDKIDREQIGTGALWRRLDDNLILWLLWIVAAAIGIVFQLSARERAILPDDRWTRIPPGARVA
jgi:hypothetical protein